MPHLPMAPVMSNTAATTQSTTESTPLVSYAKYPRTIAATMRTILSSVPTLIGMINPYLSSGGLLVQILADGRVQVAILCTRAAGEA